MNFRFYFLSYLRIYIHSGYFFFIRLFKNISPPSVLGGSNIAEMSFVLNDSLPPNDLVVGLALNYRKTDVFNFISSLRSVNQQCKIILIIDPFLDQETRSFLSENNINFITWNHEKKYDPHLLNVRFEVISIILQSLKNNLRKVFISDVRDVFFQKDIFTICTPLEGKVTVFEESGLRRFSECEVNTFWYLFLFGFNSFKFIRDKPIICAGTIYGYIDDITDYINWHLQIYKWSLANIFGSERLNSDQAIHNFLVHSYPSLFLVDSSLTNVFTVSTSKNLSPYLRNDLIWIGDLCPAVFHQYDRSPLLLNLINKSFHFTL